ncbi:MAG: chitobiase/beta-hexosaminidase C-terminal domain-containing protein [Duncaniella sp.]|nr:chitobiase/beta-hexosaminidase C-terminal domain-containing protein [Duncaniella sp.]
MKKIFTLLTVLLCTVLANAQTYEFYYSGGKKAYNDDAAKSFFEVAGSDKSGNTATGSFILPSNDEEISTNKGLKVNSSGTVTFNLESSATVTMFFSATQSAGSFPGINGEALTADDVTATPATGFTNVVIYEKKLTAGSYTVSYLPAKKELCLFYIGVVMDEVKGEKLPAPEVSFNSTTGEVTIGAVANATKVVYTTDGKMPTEESTEYTAPFTVADGTVVKAMAIGNGETYANSSVAEVEVLLVGQTVEAPVFAQFNGTFALSTKTNLASCEYSLDGETWVAYTMPVTLFETATVKARAVRENWTNSEVVEAEITALPALKGTKKVYLGGGAFNIVDATKEKGGILEGIADGEAAGYSIEINMAEKGWAKGSTITISDEVQRTSYYGSNGAQNILTLPEGVTAKRVTFYSYMPSLGRTSGWNEVAGENITDFSAIPLLSKDPEKPDVRVFDLNDVTGSFTFSQTGERPNFVVVLDIVDPDAEPETGNNFGEAALAAPKVWPVNNSKMMTLAGGINLTFDAEVQVAGKATLGDKEVELIPVENQVFIAYEGLEPLTEYTLTIPAGTIGNAEAQNTEDLVYTFTTRMENVKYYTDFNVYPEGFFNVYGNLSGNLDILAKNSTDKSEEVGGMTFFSGTKGRVVAMKGVFSADPEADYGPADATEDAGATTQAVQLIDGGNGLYVEFPEMEGPADVTFWLGNPGTAEFSVVLTDENGDTKNPLATFTLPAAKKIKKFTYTYPYKGSVSFRLYNMGKKVDINDVLIVKGEGEGIDKPVYKDEEAPVLTFSWPSASPYAPTEGNIVLIYNEPIVAAAKAVVNGVETEITVDDKTATIAYAGLEKGKTYTVQIPAIADEAGNATEAFEMTLATEAENVLFYTDFNYFPYSYWDAFHIYPVEGADNGDILAKNSTDQTAEFGGITYSVGATAGRVVAMGKSNLLGATDEENLGASQRCIQISGGGDALYAQLPEVQGPAEITLLVGNSTAKDFTFELRNGEATDALAQFTTVAEKTMQKFSYKYVATEKVTFRIYNMGNQFNLHDILVVKAEGGQSGIDAIAAGEDAPVVYYNLQGQRVANPAAGLYIRVQGNDVKKVIVK